MEGAVTLTSTSAEQANQVMTVFGLFHYEPTSAFGNPFINLFKSMTLTFSRVCFIC